MRQWKRNTMGAVFCLGTAALLAGCGGDTAQSKDTAGSANGFQSKLEEPWTEPLAVDKTVSTIQSVRNKAQDVGVHVTQPEETVTAEWLCHSTDGGETYTIVGETYDVDALDFAEDADGVYYDTLTEKQGIYTYQMMYQLEDGSYIGSNTMEIYRLDRPTAKLRQSDTSSAVLSWDENPAASGYQVRYAADKDFSDPVTKRVAVGEKPEISFAVEQPQYWAKVRSYVKTDGKIDYSAWSSVQELEVTSQ